MKKLVENHNNLTLKGFYTNFQQIHPFTNGNNRINAILYNLKKDSLNNLRHPDEIN